MRFLLFLLVVLQNAVVSYADWNREIVDVDNVSPGTSLALDEEDNPCIAFIKGNGVLKFTVRNGSTWQTEVAVPWATSCKALRSPSLVLDSTGNPHIAFNHSLQYNNYVRYTHKDSYWHTSSITPSFCYYPSLALDSGDNPRVVYTSSYNLEYCLWDGFNWEYEVLDSGTGSTSLCAPSIELDTLDQEHIVYYAADSNSLNYVTNIGLSWSYYSIDTLYGGNYQQSLILDVSGYPHIAYCDWTNGILKYAYSDGVEWHIESIGTFGATILPSLCLSTSGLPHISFYSYGNLMYAQKSGNVWIIETVDSIGDVGYYSSLTLDSTGCAHISYIDATNSNLIYTRNTSTSTEESSSFGLEMCHLLSIHPNPSFGVFTIQYSSPDAAIIQVSIYDIHGRLISESTLEESSIGNYSVLMSGLETGIYFCQIRSDDIFQTERFTVLQN